MSDSSATRQFCTFRLAQHQCGIDVLAVHEILRQQPLTRVPLAPPMVKGLINLRGQIITALDMRARFGFPPREDGRHQVNLVVDTSTDEGESASALLVDEIGDVIDIDPATCEPPPETMPERVRDLITSVCKLEHGLLLILDVRKAATIS